MSKFKKGTFAIVPNKEYLDELSTNAQCLWLWLCIYADENGECFPSRKLLARNTKRSVRAIDYALDELEEKKWVKRVVRYQKKDKMEQTTNLYQLYLLDGKPKAPPCT
jgi:hypothetical protein